MLERDWGREIGMSGGRGGAAAVWSWRGRERSGHAEAEAVGRTTLCASRPWWLGVGCEGRELGFGVSRPVWATGLWGWELGGGS